MTTVYLGAMFTAYIIGFVGVYNKYKASTLTKVSVFTIFFVISGFRSPSSIGDTYFYSHSYRLLVQNPILNSDAKDIGFNVLMLLLTKISADPQILIILTAFITNIFIILALYRYGKPFELSVFLYFGTVIYYVTMNGIRQSMVAAILFFFSLPLPASANGSTKCGARCSIRLVSISSAWSPMLLKYNFLLQIRLVLVAYCNGYEVGRLRTAGIKNSIFVS